MALKRFALALIIGLMPVLPVLADSHGPTRQNVMVTQEFAASPEQVWGYIGDFQDITWHPAVHASEGENGNEVGATRLLTIGGAGGPTLSEILDKHSDDERSYSYRITEVDVAVLPVTEYEAHITVLDGNDGGSVVEWKGSFLRGDPSENPPEELSDQAAVKAITGVYESGLAALVAHFE